MSQRKVPNKRYSSYIPPISIPTLEQHVVEHMSDKTPDPNNDLQRSRLKSDAPPHFNALQTAVSKLARIDDFHLEELGYGFFSDVFKVTHKLTGKVMVLKRNKNTNTKLNILREVQLMNRLSHPNILKYMGVCVHEGQLHALTEFVNGGDLDQLIEKRDIPLSWCEKIGLSIDVASGIEYLHSMGIFHRDMTAKNCLVKIYIGPNNVKTYTGIVADLGLAEKIPKTLDKETKLSIVGSPYYMAPEVLCNKPYNNIADVFSFGIILCQLIARVSAEPEQLPRTMDFGLAIDLFKQLAARNSGEVPPMYLQLAFDCCKIDPVLRARMPKILSVLKKCLKSCKLTGKAHHHNKQPTDINGNPIPPNTEENRSKLKNTKASLQRSYSDITSDVVADNNQYNYVLQQAFINPFDTLEYLDVGLQKIVDKPSAELFELTFDLPSPIHSTAQMRRKKDGSNRRKQRPNSLFVEEKDSVFMSKLSPLQSTNKNFTMENKSSAILNLKIPTPPTRKDVEGAQSCALLFSPHGMKYSAWWRSCQRNFINNTTAPMSPILQDIVKKSHKLRRSVSLPNIHRYEFHSREIHRKSALLSDSVDVTQRVRSETRFTSSATSTDEKQRNKSRSKTIDNVFHEIASLESLPEEVETKDCAKEDKSDRSVSFSDEITSISDESISPSAPDVRVDEASCSEIAQFGAKSFNRCSRDSGFNDDLINGIITSVDTNSSLPEHDVALLPSTNV